MAFTKTPTRTVSDLPATRVCSLCVTETPASAFVLVHRRDRGTVRLGSYCKPCFKLYMRRRRAANPMIQEQERRAGWRYRLKNAYGMTEADWYRLLESQGWGCAICGAKDAGRKLSVDHDHKTGKVRGILCAACNHAIGRMDDDPERLEAAAAFLRRHREV